MKLLANLRRTRLRRTLLKRTLIESLQVGLAWDSQIKKWAERELPNGEVVGRIKNAQTVNYKTLKPVKDGLFCEKIFGPIKDFECACGLKQTKGGFCPQCHVEFTRSEVRRYRLGYVQLPSAVTHVWYLRGRPSYISYLLGMKMKKAVALTYGAASLLVNSQNERVISQEENESLTFSFTVQTLYAVGECKGKTVPRSQIRRYNPNHFLFDEKRTKFLQNFFYNFIYTSRHKILPNQKQNFDKEKKDSIVAKMHFCNDEIDLQSQSKENTISAGDVFGSQKQNSPAVNSYITKPFFFSSIIRGGWQPLIVVNLQDKLPVNLSYKKAHPKYYKFKKYLKFSQNIGFYTPPIFDVDFDVLNEVSMRSIEDLSMLRIEGSDVARFRGTRFRGTRESGKMLCKNAFLQGNEGQIKKKTPNGSKQKQEENLSSVGINRLNQTFGVRNVKYGGCAARFRGTRESGKMYFCNTIVAKMHFCNHEINLQSKLKESTAKKTFFVGHEKRAKFFSKNLILSNKKNKVKKSLVGIDKEKELSLSTLIFYPLKKEISKLQEQKNLTKRSPQLTKRFYQELDSKFKFLNSVEKATKQIGFSSIPEKEINFQEGHFVALTEEKQNVTLPETSKDAKSVLSSLGEKNQSFTLNRQELPHFRSLFHFIGQPCQLKKKSRFLVHTASNFSQTRNQIFKILEKEKSINSVYFGQKLSCYGDNFKDKYRIVNNNVKKKYQQNHLFPYLFCLSIDFPFYKNLNSYSNFFVPTLPNPEKTLLISFYKNQTKKNQLLNLYDSFVKKKFRTSTLFSCFENSSTISLKDLTNVLSICPSTDYLIGGCAARESGTRESGKMDFCNTIVQSTNDPSENWKDIGGFATIPLAGVARSANEKEKIESPKNLVEQSQLQKVDNNKLSDKNKNLKDPLSASHRDPLSASHRDSLSGVDAAVFSRSEKKGSANHNMDSQNEFKTRVEEVSMRSREGVSMRSIEDVSMRSIEDLQLQNKNFLEHSNQVSDILGEIPLVLPLSGVAPYKFWHRKKSSKFYQQKNKILQNRAFTFWKLKKKAELLKNKQLERFVDTNSESQSRKGFDLFAPLPEVKQKQNFVSQEKLKKDLFIQNLKKKFLSKTLLELHNDSPPFLQDISLDSFLNSSKNQSSLRGLLIKRPFFVEVKSKFFKNDVDVNVFKDKETKNKKQKEGEQALHKYTNTLYKPTDFFLEKSLILCEESAQFLEKEGKSCMQKYIFPLSRYPRKRSLTFCLQNVRKRAATPTPDKEVSMRSIEEVSMRSIEEVSMRSIEEVSMRSIEEVSMQSIEEVSMQSIEGSRETLFTTSSQETSLTGPLSGVGHHPISVFDEKDKNFQKVNLFESFVKQNFPPGWKARKQIKKILKTANILRNFRKVVTSPIPSVKWSYLSKKPNKEDYLFSIYETSIQQALGYTCGEAILKLLSPINCHQLESGSKVLLWQINEQIPVLENQGFLLKPDIILLNLLRTQKSITVRRLKIAHILRKTKILPKQMVFSVLPVLPPNLRPIIQLDENVVAVSDCSQIYQKIVQRSNRLSKKMSKYLSYETCLGLKVLLQQAVDGLIENGKGGSKPLCDNNGRPLKSLSDGLKGKKGRFRQDLLGRRVDYSGRSVIVVGPALKLHQCGLPKEMAIELFQPFLIRQLFAKKIVNNIAVAKNYIKKETPIVLEILKQLLRSHPVLLNRAPTLHRLGVQAFQPKLVSGRAILLHPLVCSAFNADFDGDQMAVHIPLSSQARGEAWKILWSRNNILSPATGQPILVPSQDMVLGCYYLTTKKTNFITKKYFGAEKENRKKWSFVYSDRPCQDVDVFAAPTEGKQKQRLPPIGEKQSGVLRRGLFFNNSYQVLKDLQQKRLKLHTSIWLKMDRDLEVHKEEQKPLEVRINSCGNFTKIYPGYLRRFYKKEGLLFNTNRMKKGEDFYVHTTCGRVMLNQTISPTSHQPF